MKKWILAAIGLCFITLLAGGGDAQEKAETFKQLINPEQIIKALNVSPQKAEKLKEQLAAINQIMAEFHVRRIWMETNFARESGLLPRNQRRSIDDFTAEVLDTARIYQQRVNQELASIQTLLSSDELEKFRNIDIPDLTEPGKTVFGLYRRPSDPEAREEMQRKMMKRMSGEKEQLMPKLQLVFNHDNHEERGVECITCHQSADSSQIAKAYQKPQRGPALMRQGPNYIAEMGTCNNCHDGETASDKCVTCHPNWQPTETYLSSEKNKFEDIKIGMEAPTFTLKDVYNIEFSLAQFRGKKIVVFQFGSST